MHDELAGGMLQCDPFNSDDFRSFRDDVLASVAADDTPEADGGGIAHRGGRKSFAALKSIKLSGVGERLSMKQLIPEQLWQVSLTSSVIIMKNCGRMRKTVPTERWLSG
mmetsp:Transcript_3383/g.7774  ORF Transcript_3383/g.7774 Transcript_3383/m.7774 type:complete len:109 (+) Transcript_3383:65-391(+)